MSPSPVAVTGSTGQVGGRVARRLSAAGVPQRLLVRDPSRAPRLPGATIVVAPYADGDAVRRALEGVGTVFMVSASESADRVDQHRAFVDAAAAAGVRHLVYLSFQGAAPDATFTLARDHWATEEHVRARGLRSTFLRDALYADFLPGLVGEDGVIRGPAGDGRVAAVAQDDVADAAVAVLREPAAHAGRTYDLTGPEALTLAEVAATITAVTGRPVRYHAETVEEAFASRASYGAPDWQVEAWVSTYTAIAAGEMAAVSSAVPGLTGHPATPFEQLLRAGDRAARAIPPTAEELREW
ncbi:SDR family oxidoreductase [Geodermatophilus arenarius]|uniref:SDR family oxidoreductase n=1 Tax=Geodermatophilus arenarius TaxID=1137990 RepID=A0ABV9LNM2_9ACTN